MLEETLLILSKIEDLQSSENNLTNKLIQFIGWIRDFFTTDLDEIFLSANSIELDEDLVVLTANGEKLFSLSITKDGEDERLCYNLSRYDIGKDSGGNHPFKDIVSLKIYLLYNIYLIEPTEKLSFLKDYSPPSFYSFFVMKS